MNIKIGIDKLTFVNLPDSQLKSVIECSSSCRVTNDNKKIIVHGKPSDLYKLLYKLSYDYDIELS